ncbi:hypothetical protein GCM10027610_096880 [Dactylosporangium cerinum]
MVVHREDLHDAFIAGLSDQVDIRNAIEVQPARVRRERPAVGDGRTTFEADLIVAADGVQSAIRRRLAPATSFTSGGFAAWRAVIPWYRIPDLPPGLPPHGETLDGGHRFTFASLGERGSSGGSTRGGISWVATVPGALRPEPPRASWRCCAAGSPAGTPPSRSCSPRPNPTTWSRSRSASWPRCRRPSACGPAPAATP